MTEDYDTSLHAVVSEGSIDVGERLITTIDGIEVGLFRTEDGYFAAANFCPHQGGPLCEGLLSGTVTVNSDYDLQYTSDSEILFCPWHGWEFDLKTGDHLAQTGLKVPTFETIVKDGKVHVRI
jgi:nitrite reductase/ring-hydroxylating ferredoxin subunit